ncbi:AIPR family protein [Sporosarcina sp. UB5]|uniref:AIPR family protein n=1 Tax=Sporosarcina sp. UB5 TaxID=3047463 RepID=UPI003D7BFFF7
MGNSLTLLDAILDEYKLNFSNENKDVVFEYFVTENYFKERDLALDEIKTGLIGGQLDWGIDGIFIFLNDRLINSMEEVEIENRLLLELIFFQFKNQSSIDETPIQNFNSIAPHIINLADEIEVEGINPEVIEKIKLAQEIIKKIASKHPKINFNFIHASKGNKENIYGPLRVNKSYQQRVADLEKQIMGSQLGNIHFKYEVIDASDLIDLSRNTRSYSLSLKLNENPIFVEYGEGGQKGYMATVLMKDYYDFLVDSSNNKLRKYLFEANIRDFQNNTVVNNDIKDSIKKETDIDFWWLNNGVTIIADEGTLVGKQFHLDNIQIVNGLQTSHSIYNVFSEDQQLKESDSRSLFIKIIITKEKESRDRIIKSTNSQNPVPHSLLRATDKVQRNIEDYFLRKDYFYDRRKNYYRNLQKPISKIISINYLSQCLTAILFDNPSKARSNPTILTKSDEDYDLLFPQRRDTHVYYNCILIMKQTEEYLKTELQTKDEEDEAITKYYSLHLARVVASVFFRTNNITDKILSSTDEIRIESDQFSESMKLFKKILIDYRIKTQQKDLVNISKSSAFSKNIIDELKNKFTQVPSSVKL